MSKARLCGLAAIIIMALAGSARARRWSDEVFEHKVSMGTPYLAVTGRDPSRAHSVVGSARFYQVQKSDTFLDVARYYDLGYNEISEANPGIDPWIPPPGQIILLPTEWVLPDAEYKGVVLNIPEMRLYYFHPGAEGTTFVNTYPVGLGRDDLAHAGGKVPHPRQDRDPSSWVLPESIKAEHRRDGKPAPDFIAGGAPDNPLGKYRLELSLPLYGIHGTDIPWGVGHCGSATAASASIRKISNACSRRYRWALRVSSSTNQ